MSGWKIVDAILYGRKSSRWQVFFADGEDWTAKNPDDVSDFTVSRLGAFDVLDSEPASMVQEMEIDGREYVGILLPDQRKFYALLS